MAISYEVSLTYVFSGERVCNAAAAADVPVHFTPPKEYLMNITLQCSAARHFLLVVAALKFKPQEGSDDPTQRPSKGPVLSLGPGKASWRPQVSS